MWITVKERISLYQLKFLLKNEKNIHLSTSQNVLKNKIFLIRLQKKRRDHIFSDCTYLFPLVQNLACDMTRD